MEPPERADGHTLTITRLYAAGREKVFNAWTTVESVRQWMCPEEGAVVLAEMDVRVGGSFRIGMLVDGERTIHTGVYRVIVPPEKLVFTWTSRYTQQVTTLVTVELRAIGDQTELTLTQVRLPDEEATRLHARGWTQIVEHLEHDLRASQLTSDA